MREKILSVLALMSISQAFAQDNLINALANNQGKDVQKYYQIKPIFAVGVNLLELCRVFFLGIRNDQKEKTTCRLG